MPLGPWNTDFPGFGVWDARWLGYSDFPRPRLASRWTPSSSARISGAEQRTLGAVSVQLFKDAEGFALPEGQPFLKLWTI